LILAKRGGFFSIPKQTPGVEEERAKRQAQGKEKRRKGGEVEKKHFFSLSLVN